LATWGSTS